MGFKIQHIEKENRRIILENDENKSTIIVAYHPDDAEGTAALEAAKEGNECDIEITDIEEVEEETEEVDEETGSPKKKKVKRKKSKH